MVYYYKQKIPSIDDIVVAKVNKITNLGVEVSLTEYNNLSGFINFSEVSRKKRININKIITVGKEILLIVIQIDKNNGYIDLSKRSINDEEIKLFNEKNKQHIHLYNIFKYIFMKLNKIEKHDQINPDNIYDFMNYTLWNIQSELDNNIILEQLLLKSSNSDIIKHIDFNNLSYTIEQIKSIIDEYIDTKLNRVKPSLNDSIKILSYGINGLNDIKEVLNCNNYEKLQILFYDYEIKISYISSSLYSIDIQQKEFENSQNIDINQACEIIKSEIKNKAIEKNLQYKINL